MLPVSHLHKDTENKIFLAVTDKRNMHFFLGFYIFTRMSLNKKKNLFYYFAWICSPFFKISKRHHYWFSGWFRNLKMVNILVPMWKMCANTADYNAYLSMIWRMFNKHKILITFFFFFLMQFVIVLFTHCCHYSRDLPLVIRPCRHSKVQIQVLQRSNFLLQVLHEMRTLRHMNS